VAWLGTLWLANVLLFVLLTGASVDTVRGQMLDTVALAGNSLGRRTVDAPLDATLGAISAASIGVILIIILVVALARRRLVLALMSAVVVLGTTATTYLAKGWLIHRPDLGIDPDRAGAGNSLPSGHAAAAAAFAIGLTLVLPPVARGAVSLLGATYAAVVGVATLSSGWHRPSDVVAAYLVAGGWAAFAGLVLVLVQGPSPVVRRRERAEWSLATAVALGLFLAVIGVALLLYVAQQMTDPVELMPAPLLRLGYLGSVLAVAGAAYLMMAVVLISVHRVVPHAATGKAHADDQSAAGPSYHLPPSGDSPDGGSGQA
jgi:membrane-associated phospholipid phosphatase